MVPSSERNCGRGRERGGAVRKFILKILGGLIINAILGVISLFALNSLFGLGITITPIIILAAAIFGLPGMVVIIILHFLGIVA